MRHEASITRHIFLKRRINSLRSYCSEREGLNVGQSRVIEAEGVLGGNPRALAFAGTALRCSIKYSSAQLRLTCPGQFASAGASTLESCSRA